MAGESQQGPSHRQMSGLLVMVLVFGLAGLALPFLFGGPGRWEYTIESPDDLKLSLDLNRLGSQGWEVVAARRATSGSSYSSTAAYELILKRKIGLLAPTRTDYALLDRQGTTLFAFLDKRWVSDTSRIRSFGANFCAGMKTCTVHFWTTKPTTAFSLPLAPEMTKTQVAVYAKPGGQILFPNR